MSKMNSRENSDYNSVRCIRTMPESNLQILCKCKENSTSNGYNGVNMVQCTESNCINQNGSNNGHDSQKNGHDSNKNGFDSSKNGHENGYKNGSNWDRLNETRYKQTEFLK